MPWHVACTQVPHSTEHPAEESVGLSIWGPSLVNDVHDVLVELGSTPHEVATSLRKKGIRGVRNTVRFLNPIVRFTQEYIPGPRSIDVIMGDTIRVVFPDGKEEKVPLPTSIRTFLEAFHRGDFPDLEMANVV